MTLQRPKLTPMVGGNFVCADCTDPDPSWASLNRGVFICTECCSIHRSLGRHVSQVKSLKRTAWNSKQLALVQTLYAHGSNNVWEHFLLDPTGSTKTRKKPGHHDPLYPTKADFIRAKYQNLSFALKPGRGFSEAPSSNNDGGASSLADLNRQLHSCVRTGHVETTLRLLALGADPNGYVDPETGATPLHVAAREGQDLQVELLVLYGADPITPDLNGQKPADLAESSGNHDLSLRLIELQYELSDRLVGYLCGGRKPDHANGQHFIIPEIATQSDAAADKAARKRLMCLTDAAYEKLAQDAYDEVDRREVDASWSACLSEDALLINDRYVVPFLPVNADLPATRNQRRQKLAKFNGREFATFLIDIISEARRRWISAGQVMDKSLAESQISDQKQPGTRERMVAETNGSRGNSASTDSPMQMSAKDITNSVKSEEIDGPLYDTVASDDEYRESTPASRAGAGKHNYMDLKGQLVVAEARVEELEKRNSDVSNEVEQLRMSIDRLSTENQKLKSFSFQTLSEGQYMEPELLKALQTLHSPTAPVSTTAHHPSRTLAMRHSMETEVVVGAKQSEKDIHRHRRGASVDMILNQDTTSLSPADCADYDSVDGSPEPSSVYPDNLILKTEELTAEIHQLLGAAQAGRHDRFPSHAIRIQSVVDSMVHAVPVQFKRKSIKHALDSMVDACILLTVRCSNNNLANISTTGDRKEKETISCQIVQVAYDVARAAKELMLLIQK